MREATRRHAYTFTCIARIAYVQTHTHTHVTCQSRRGGALSCVCTRCRCAADVSVCVPLSFARCARTAVHVKCRCHHAYTNRSARVCVTYVCMHAESTRACVASVQHMQACTHTHTLCTLVCACKTLLPLVCRQATSRHACVCVCVRMCRTRTVFASCVLLFIFLCLVVSCCVCDFVCVCTHVRMHVCHVQQSQCTCST